MEARSLRASDLNGRSVGRSLPRPAPPPLGAKPRRGVARHDLGMPGPRSVPSRAGWSGATEGVTARSGAASTRTYRPLHRVRSRSTPERPRRHSSGAGASRIYEQGNDEDDDKEAEGERTSVVKLSTLAYRLVIAPSRLATSSSRTARPAVTPSWRAPATSAGTAPEEHRARLEACHHGRRPHVDVAAGAALVVPLLPGGRDILVPGRDHVLAFSLLGEEGPWAGFVRAVALSRSASARSRAASAACARARASSTATCVGGVRARRRRRFSSGGLRDESDLRGHAPLGRCPRTRSAVKPPRVLASLDAWIRRRLRMYLWRQW